MPKLARVLLGAPRLPARPLPLGGVWTLVIGFLICLIMINRFGGGGADFAVYYVGGLSVLDGGDIYFQRDDIVPLPFTYPPFSAVVFAPVSALGLEDGGFFWLAGSVAATCYVVAEAVALLRLSGWRRDAIFAVAAYGVFHLEPVWMTLALGQINTYLMALIVADMCGRLPWLPRGFLIGVAAGIKLTPLIFVVYLAMTGRWRAARNAVVTFFGTIALAFVVVPSESWEFWTDLVFQSHRIAIGGHSFASNQSIDGVVARYVVDLSGDTALWLIFGGVIGLAGLLLAVCISRQGHELLAVSTCGVTALLVAPIAWTNHHVWVIPAAFALVVFLKERLGWLAGAAVAAPWLAIYVMSPVLWVPRWPPSEFNWTLRQEVMGNSYVLAELAWLCMMAALVATRQWSAPVEEERRRAAADLHGGAAEDESPTQPQSLVSVSPDSR
jgi:alpha-1,2-mannosyltransferase